MISKRPKLKICIFFILKCKDYMRNRDFELKLSPHLDSLGYIMIAMIISLWFHMAPGVWHIKQSPFYPKVALIQIFNSFEQYFSLNWQLQSIVAYGRNGASREPLVLL